MDDISQAADRRHMVSICRLSYVIHMENICKPCGYAIWKPGANHIKYHMIPIWHSHMYCIWASYNNAIGGRSACARCFAAFDFTGWLILPAVVIVIMIALRCQRQTD